MTTPPIGDAMRLLVAGARKARGQDGVSQLDRTLAAVTLLGVAVVIAWPRDRPIPEIAARVGRLGQHVWDRRSWWAAS